MIFRKRKKNQKKNAERGAALTEYALLVALIAVVGAMSVKAVGEKATTNFEKVEQSMGAGGIEPPGPLG